MSLAKYNALLKVMEYSSITKAAEEIGYTQSGISYMIKTLENEIGFPLLIRSKEGVIPTENAIKLKPILNRLMATQHELELAVNDIRNEGEECIKIGSYNSMLLDWVPRIMKRFFLKYPNADVNLIEGNDSELEEMLTKGEIDVAFTAEAVPEGFCFLPLAEDPFFVIMPQNHVLTSKESLEIEDLFDFELILPDEKYYSWINYYIEDSTDTTSGHLNYSLRDASSILYVVANELAISILPQRAMPFIPDNVAIRPFKENYFRRLGIAYPDKRKIPNIITDFLNISGETVAAKKL